MTLVKNVAVNCTFAVESEQSCCEHRRSLQIIIERKPLRSKLYSCHKHSSIFLHMSGNMLIHSKYRMSSISSS